MLTIRFIFSYLTWHFGKGFHEVFQLWKNLSWFGYHFFSIHLLLRTLIRPLYRIHQSAPSGSGINVELFFENLTVNFIARIVGLFLRLCLILCGIIYQICLVFFGAHTSSRMARYADYPLCADHNRHSNGILIS